MIKGKDVNQMDAEDIHFRCLSSEKVTLDQMAEAGSQQMEGKHFFLTFPVCFSIPIIFSNLNLNCSDFLDMRNLQEQVKKAFCYQKLF